MNIFSNDMSIGWRECGGGASSWLRLCITEKQCEYQDTMIPGNLIRIIVQTSAKVVIARTFQFSP